ncbi:MAG: 5-(carboxyamino)imidazole ribonucleotide mutase [Planctomycetes bacterium]|nr:5-(carboxyamino)imidazole ribonucleotide mutase [Planctomycetota bacterium]
MAETFDVAILMGSKSDWGVMKHAADTLGEFGVSHESRILSAHRTPEPLAEFVRRADKAGTRVFIAGAGAAAHLAGAVAAQTVRPVLGVPLAATELNGLDALLATVQMPGGMPVGTLAIGKAGAVNAALLAVAILGNDRPDLLEKLRTRRRDMAERILAERLT